MTLTGKMLIGRQAVAGSREPIQAINPASGQALEPVWAGGSAAQGEQGCRWEERRVGKEAGSRGARDH